MTKKLSLVAAGVAIIACATPAQAAPFAYVTNGDNVSQYDVGAFGQLSPLVPQTVAAGLFPQEAAVSPDGGSVYVTNVSSDTVSQYDVGAGGALTAKSPAEVAAGDTPAWVAVSPLTRMPTSKDQCKNGGWRSFGIFKNQGDCVSFVRHQARQECVFIRAAHGRPAFRAQYGSGIHKRHAMRRCIRERMND